MYSDPEHCPEHLNIYNYLEKFIFFSLEKVLDEVSNNFCGFLLTTCRSREEAKLDPDGCILYVGLWIRGSGPVSNSKGALTHFGMLLDTGTHLAFHLNVILVLFTED
jgi:hypothetical protein